VRQYIYELRHDGRLLYQGTCWASSEDEARKNARDLHDWAEDQPLSVALPDLSHNALETK